MIPPPGVPNGSTESTPPDPSRATRSSRRAPVQATGIDVDPDLGDPFAEVPDLRGQVTGFVVVFGVVGQELAPLFHGGAAAGGVDDDDFDIGGDEGVDVAAGGPAGGEAVAAVQAEGAAAGLVGRDDDLATGPGQNTE